MSQPDTQGWSFPHPNSSSDDDWVYLTVTESGVLWSGDLRSGPVAGPYGIGTQTHEELLEAPLQPLPGDQAAEIRAACEAFIAARTRPPVLEWTEAGIARELPDVDSLERCDTKGRTALTLAVEWGWDDLVGRLLDAGVDPAQRDQTPGRPTALWVATHSVRPEAIARLLEAGADPQRDLGHREGCLEWVLGAFHSDEARRLGALQALLEAGAPADGHPDADASPLMLAVESGQLDIAQLLLDHGAGLEVARRRGTPLTHAAGELQLAGLRWLLERGARVDRSDPSGCTALERARESACVTHKEACAALLESWEAKARSAD